MASSTSSDTLVTQSEDIAEEGGCTLGIAGAHVVQVCSFAITTFIDILFQGRVSTVGVGGAAVDWKRDSVVA